MITMFAGWSSSKKLEMRLRRGILAVNELSWIDSQTYASDVYQSNNFDEKRAVVMSFQS